MGREDKVWGERCALTESDDWSELGLPEDVEEALRDALTRPGLILFTAPHGHGKRALIRRCLESSDSGRRAVYSIFAGPPAEGLDDVVQIPVRSEIGFTRSRALRAALRVQPDVIALDQLTDWETANTVVYGARGRTVLSCVFLGGPVAALELLHDMGVEKRPLAKIALTVVATWTLPTDDGTARVANVLRCAPEELAGDGWERVCAASRAQAVTLRAQALALADSGRVSREAAQEVPDVH